MISRARLHRLASVGAAVANQRRVRIGVQLLLLAGLVFVLLRIRSIWGSSHIRLGRVEWAWLGAALVLAICAALVSAFIWVIILRWLGIRARATLAGVFLQAQLGKYLPGALWQYAGRGALARARGVPLRVVARSLLVEFLASTLAGAAFTFLLLGWWGMLGAAAAVCAARLVGTRVRSEWAMARVSAEATLLYAVASWPLIGVSFWMTARAFVHVSVRDMAVYAGAFAVAWIVGLVAIYAPGGLGVREAVLVALLHGRLGSADALVVAAASRGIFTVADLVGAGVGVATSRRPSGTAVEPAR